MTTTRAPKLLLALGITASLVLLTTENVQAQSFSLSLKPEINSITLPYQDSVVSVPITLQNTSDQALRMSLSIIPIKEIDKLNNRPIYQSISELNSSQQSFYNSAISYELDGQKVNEVVLASKQTAVLNVILTNKTNLNASEHYFTLVFTENSPHEQGNAKENQTKASSDVLGALGAHFLISTGSTQPDVSLDNFSTPALFSEPLPELNIELSNSSAKHTALQGSVSIYNLLGQEIGSYEVDEYILGDSTKQIKLSDVKEDTEKGPLLTYGLNSAKLNLKDDAGEIYQSSIIYAAIPFNFIATGVIVIFFVGYILTRALKKASSQK